MKHEHKKIIKNSFQWIATDNRTDFPPVKPEPRKPLLWLDSLPNEEGLSHELFLINDTGEPIDLIEIASGGFVTQDDDVVVAKTDAVLRYENVSPGDALKIDEYDGYYDLDYLIQVEIKLQSKTLGHMLIRTPAEKGGIKGETILLWNTGEEGKHVYLKRLRDS